MLSASALSPLIIILVWTGFTLYIMKISKILDTVVARELKEFMTFGNCAILLASFLAMLWLCWGIDLPLCVSSGPGLSAIRMGPAP